MEPKNPFELWIGYEVTWCLKEAADPVIHRGKVLRTNETIAFLLEKGTRYAFDTAITGSLYKILYVHV